MTDYQKDLDKVKTCLSRLKALADALTMFAEIERKQVGERMTVTGMYADGRYSAFHLAASSIYDALSGRVPEGITSNYLKAPIARLDERSYEDLILGDK